MLNFTELGKSRSSDGMDFNWAAFIELAFMDVKSERRVSIRRC